MSSDSQARQQSSKKPTSIGGTQKASPREQNVDRRLAGMPTTDSVINESPREPEVSGDGFPNIGSVLASGKTSGESFKAEENLDS